MRVWFNHWFSSVYRIIETIKKHHDVVVIGSCNNKKAVYKTVCDEWYDEPIITDDDQYAEWCLNFCKEHNINVFIPRRNFVAISKHKQEFENLGIHVMVESDYELVKQLDDKLETFKLFEQKLPNNAKLTPMLIANNVEQFKQHYQTLKEKYKCDVCIKYAKDVGGASFRIITEDDTGIKVLDSHKSRKLGYTAIVEILGSVPTFKDLIVMPFIKGMEVSVDCLNTSKGLVAIPRYKMGNRLEKIEFNDTILHKCKEVAETLNLTQPFNLQYIVKNGEYYLLEINTRMSGGIYLSSLAGIDFAHIAYCNLMGYPFELPTDLKDMHVTHVETGVIIE